MEAAVEPEPVQESPKVVEPESVSAEELQQKAEKERKSLLLKSVLSEEVEKIEVLSESADDGPGPETLIGEEDSPEVFEELEGQQDLLAKPLENLLEEDSTTMELSEFDSSSTLLESGVNSTLEDFSSSEGTLSSLTESALKDLDNRSLFEAPKVENVSVSSTSLSELNQTKSALSHESSGALRENTVRLKQQVEFSEKESSVLDRAKPERMEIAKKDRASEKTVETPKEEASAEMEVADAPETNFEKGTFPETKTGTEASLSKLQETQTAEEPTKIQTASKLVQLERKTLRNEESLQVSGREISDAPQPKASRVQAVEPKSQPALVVQKENVGLGTGSGSQSNDSGAGDGNEIVIANLDLEDLENLSLDDLKELEKTLPEGGTSGNVNLKDVLGKLKLGKIDLKKIRKRGKLSKEETKNAVEVVNKNAALFSAGKSKIRDKIKPLNLLQYREYLMKVDPLLRQKWKIPLEISAKLEVRVKLIVDRKGTILQYAFVDISGNKIFDQSVRDLLNELEVLLPLPEEFEGSLTEIGIKFKPK